MSSLNKKIYSCQYANNNLHGTLEIDRTNQSQLPYLPLYLARLFSCLLSLTTNQLWQMAAPH